MNRRRAHRDAKRRRQRWMPPAPLPPLSPLGQIVAREMELYEAWAKACTIKLSDILVNLPKTERSTATEVKLAEQEFDRRLARWETR